MNIDINFGITEIQIFNFDINFSILKQVLNIDNNFGITSSPVHKDKIYTD